MDHQFHPMYKLGFLSFSIPDDVLKILNEEAQKIQSDFSAATPYNKELAGKIAKEFAIPQVSSVLTPVVCEAAKQFWINQTDYEMAFKEHVINNSGSPDLWVNFQQKNEYNPLHNHGGLLSFVIWLKIPYDVEKEKKLNNTKISTSPTCCFKFVFPAFPSSSGMGMYPIPVSKQHEGKAIIFPSWLSHSVDPFYTSDDYRISISGNLALK